MRRAATRRMVLTVATAAQAAAPALGLLALFIGAGGGDAKERPTRFWNLTGDTVTQFALAPAGTTAFGPDQCVNDRDGTVDFDERLPLKGIRPGTYDARLRLKKGRVCHAHGLEIREGEVFSIEEKDLVGCAP